ncbi:long-chain-fatty-acid--CoA ligase [Afifella sp. IM 167]|uniref:long-chain-fatty-acid--CoA ligase n=1 Tax=Afifella sp. IM 167 TaxID=2033586 RepID=UPI001CCD472C|nr:long-chain-fatty-acid--CoA ligase [Afifella sp. IM 167]MBZ8134775.1 long-chain fatty acid--CoA ligase [Afifella sp. IM 167]
MHGLVQYEPLLLSRILQFAAENFGRVPVISWSPEGILRYDYAALEGRSRRLASALRKHGLGEGSVVGSLGGNDHRHVELFYAAPGIGAVLHTANARLAAEQIAYTVNVAGERMLFSDPASLPQIAEMRPHLTNLETVVVMAEGQPEPLPGIARVIGYEELIAEGDEAFEWPSFDERAASTLCFTSGTSGDPKGVLYSHRGTYLSAVSIAAPNYWGIGHDDTVLAMAPICHCNAWAAPYLAPMAGAGLVLPGRSFDGPSVHRMITEGGVTVATGVPTIWLGVLEHCRRTGQDLGRLNRVVAGGSAPPPELIRVMAQDFGVRTLQVWGMTETTHAATMRATGTDVESEAWKAAPQGRPTFGTRIRIVDDAGEPLPRDGATRGQLQVRGSWVATSYLGRDDVVLCDPDGWLNTGDVAALSEDGQLRIADRIKDVIKSGGEWISSIDLENAAISFPTVSEAAVVGVPHPRWMERPIMVVVPREGERLDENALRAFLQERVPKLWLPDAIVVVEELEYTSTGKVKKSVLRERYQALLSEEAAG